MTKRQLKTIIRDTIIESAMVNSSFNEAHADKLAKLIGSAEEINIRQALELGEGIGMIEKHWTHENTFAGKIIFFFVICHQSLAARIERSVKEYRNPDEKLFGFVGEMHTQYGSSPGFTKISFRLRV